MVGGMNEDTRTRLPDRVLAAIRAGLGGQAWTELSAARGRRQNAKARHGLLRAREIIVAISPAIRSRCQAALATPRSW